MLHLCLPLHSLQQADRRRVVVTCNQRTQTAADLHDQVALLSRAITNRLSVRPGDRIVLLGLNTDIFFASLLAVLDAGAVACPLNWRWSAAELAAAVALLQPTAVFVEDVCMPLAQQACSSLAASSSSSTPPWTLIRMCCEPTRSHHAHRQITSTSSSSGVIISTGDLLAGAQAASVAPESASPAAAAAAAGTQPQLQLLQAGPNQPALIVFTSGTTGASKGVMLSHASINHQSLVKLAVVQYSSSDTYLHMAPLFHIGGLSSAFAVLMAGGAHVFMPRYSPATALQLIQQHHVTSLIAVPAMMQDLTQAAAAAAGTPATPQQQLPSLQKVLVGAGGMPLRLQRAVAALFPNAVLQTAYGMTEASSSMTFISVAQQQQQQQQQLLAQAAAATASAGRGAGAVPQDCQDAAADGGGGGGVCVGKPGPGIAVRIASPAGSATNGGNHQQQQDVVGEVCTLGPHVMLGYWRDPQATAQTLQSEGWLHTGDLGYLDSKGHLWLVGRLKDMVKTGGENVHAAEVEGVLLTHPAVAAAAVFGLEHRRLGEQVAAAVVLQPGWGWGDAGTVLLPQQQPHDSQAAGRNAPQQQQCGVLTAAVLQQHCRDALLSPFKLPRVVVCAQQLPLNSSGKVVKAWLKQQVQQLLLKGGQGVQQSTPAQRSRL